MGKKSGPAAPTPPDPVATAQAQSIYNKDAAITQANLNRIDQITPDGSIKYNQIGTNTDGTPQYQQVQTYSPQQQALYDQQNQIAQSLGNTATSQISRVNNTMDTPFNYNGMTPMQTSINGGPGVQYSSAQLPGVQRGVNTGPVQSDLNYSELTKLPGTDDFSADAKRVSDALYGQATSRLDPQFNQQQSDITAKLANQGIAQGSEAYNREMDNFNRAKTDAYNQANFSATQAGGAEQSRLFGLAMGARQEGANEQQQQGTFHNQAQDQSYTQGLGNAELYNNSGQMGLSQNLALQGFNNEAQNQQFNQSQAAGNFDNNARQQQIQEATYLRNLPLNDIAALLGTGGGVQNPTFNPFAQVGVAAPDYMGQVNSTFNAQQNQYNQAQANRSAGLGSIFGLAGSLGSAALMASDRRLKTNIVRIGELANGLATYVFTYIGDTVRHFGVMAQEALGIVPEAVGAIDGYYYVDYRKVL
jgi:hypothetical protein